MKIRCSRCGKRFDADMYSGLCPKCGAYNGKHMTGYEEAEHERKEPETEGQQETAWQPQQAEEGQQDFLGESAAAEGGGSQSPAPGSARRYRTSGTAEKRSGAGGKSAGKMLLAAFLIPVIAAVGFQFWEKAYFQECMKAGAHIVRETGTALVTVIEGGEMTYPVYVGVLGTGPMPGGRLTEGWHLEGICVASICEGYNSQEQINDVQLGYEIGDETFYQTALNKYDLEQLVYEWGITEEELLAAYDLDYGESTGYFVFLVRDGAENQELILEMEGDSGSVTRQVAIPLDEADGLFYWEDWMEWNGLPTESGVAE